MTQLEIFRARAGEARAQAGQTDLPNVRERCLRAAEAWEAMADREQKLQSARATRDRARQPEPNDSGA